MDRLGELDQSEEDIAMDTTNPHLEQFFKDVGKVKENLQVVENNVVRIQKLTKARLVEVDESVSRKAGSELQNIIDQSNAAIGAVNQKLKEMDAANKDLTRDDATKRTRTNMHATLCKKFSVLIRDYQEAQTQAKMSYESQMVSEIKLVKPDVTQEEVNRIMAQDDPSRIFQQEMLGDLDQQRAKQNLLFLTERHKDVIALEKSIRELHQLFVDMAALVSQQGEMVDQIEASVASSVEHTNEANLELESAVKAARCGRRKYLIITLIVIAIIAVIVVPIVIKYTGN